MPRCLNAAPTMPPEKRSPSCGLLMVAGFALGLGACAQPLDGAWSGTCAVGEGSDQFELPVAFDVLELEDGRLGGSGTFQFVGYTFTGEAEGEHFEDHVRVDVIGVYGGYTLTVRVLGDVDAEFTKIDGHCGFMDQGVPWEGPVLMEPFGGEEGE
jgi:hypothetical protein